MKLTNIILSLSTVASFIGCGTNPVGETEQKFTVQKLTSVPRESADVSSEILTTQATSNNEFGIKMYQLLAEEGKNLFFSPYSITSALAMTAAGAEGETKTQIRDALQVKLPGVQFDEAINGIDLSLSAHSASTDGITLNIVNSTWMQAGWNFKVGYLDHLARYYGAGVNMLDFVSQPDPSRVIINDWVAEQTNSKIMDLIPKGAITTATVMVLTNAIYFLGDWLYSFNTERTAPATFCLSDNTTVQAPLMYQGEVNKKVKMHYARVGNARALDFPYKGERLSMTVLLPDQGEFSAFESSLSLEKVNELINALDTADLVVALPKFQFTFGTKSISQALATLGMVDAFTGGKADFSGIDGTKQLFISNILHKAFIAVDEKGTEAAAATAVVFDRTTADPNEVIFVVNRPFIFAIRDNETGTILFMGRILNPLLKD